MDKNLERLLGEALKWGLHDDHCGSFDAKWDDYNAQDELCSCWMSEIKKLLKPVKIIKNPEHLMCSCKHEAKDHINNGTGLCVANSCNCFKFAAQI